MEEATTEDKFHAAVELIKSLPKSGAFQPSNDLRLKFYSYFKQATEGPCTSPKPGFWDIINRAKWDAWNRLGTMPKEEAMEHYVDEFVTISQTVPFDEGASDYVHIMGPFIHLAPKEFREVHLKVNGNKDLSEDSDSPVHETEEIIENMHKANDLVKQLKGKGNNSPNDFSETPSPINGHNLNGGNDSDSEEFSDTFDKVNEDDSDDEAISSGTIVEDVPFNPAITDIKGANIIQVRGGGDRRFTGGDTNSPLPGTSGERGNRPSRHGRGSDGPSQHIPSNNPIGSAGGGRRGDGSRVLEASADVSEQLALAVIRLQHTMEQVVSRLDSLEALLQERKANSCLQVSSMKSTFRSVVGLSPQAALLILVWPFIAHWLIYVIKKRRRW